MSDTAVVWVALGTPETPTPSAVRRYLREFLSDRRIVEMNPVAWKFILELFVLPARSRASAKKYASVWYEDGSPLMVNTMKQVSGLQSALDARGLGTEVVGAMRYGQPSLSSVLDSLYDKGIRKVLIFPAYPHYSQTTVGSVYDAAARYMLMARDEMELRFIRSFPTDPAYIEALASSIERAWEETDPPDFASGDKLILSFHGIPTSMAAAGDPYPKECLATAEAVRDRLGLTPFECLLSFQSKFGPAPWLIPATIDTVAELGRTGIKRVDVVCPAFVADCLETLEEIGILNRDTYMEACDYTGVFNRIPCLNDDPAFLEAVADVAATGLAGWVK